MTDSSDYQRGRDDEKAAVMLYLDRMQREAAADALHELSMGNSGSSMVSSHIAGTIESLAKMIRSNEHRRIAALTAAVAMGGGEA